MKETAWDIEDMQFIGELPLKNGEFILNTEKIGEKYWLLHSQTESFALDFETMRIKRVIKNKDNLHII